MSNDVSFDALLPAAMAAKAEDLGVKKAALPLANMFALAVLAIVAPGCRHKYANKIDKDTQQPKSDRSHVVL